MTAPRKKAPAKSRKKSALPGTVEGATEGSKGYPDSYHVDSLRERRLLMSLRVVGFGLSMSLIVNCVLVLALFTMIPLKEVRPFLVQVAEEGSIVGGIKPIPDRFDSMEILTESLVREYIVKRNEVLRSTAIMRLRWGPEGFIGVTTASDEYSRFRNNVTSRLQEVRRERGEIRVEILGVRAQTPGQLYFVDFETKFYDRDNNIISQSEYTAQIEVGYR